MVRLGASCDWCRERFTLDPGLSRAVREVFVRLYEKGLIYRGEYMVNWCPDCHTAHLAISRSRTRRRRATSGTSATRSTACPAASSTVATTRPETMLGDTAVAINAKDARYLDLHGKTVQLPLMDREIPIILDDLADPEFGTGVVKVTPAHDLNDFEAGKRHNLPKIQVIDENGQDDRRRRPVRRPRPLRSPQARGRRPRKARRCSSKIEDYTLSLGKCQRCKTVGRAAGLHAVVRQDQAAGREGHRRRWRAAKSTSFRRTGPRPTTSGCTTSATGASRASSGGAIAFPPGTAASASEIIVARETPTACPRCGSGDLEQDTDVLDTWFSSGLWPFSTLGWPDQTDDLATLLPHVAADHRLRHPVLLGGPHGHAGHANSWATCRSARSTSTAWCATPSGRRCRRPRAT